MWIAYINDLEREVHYRPLENNGETDLSKLDIYVDGDPIFVFTINNSNYKNNMTNFIGKMAVLSNNSPINLSSLPGVVLKGMSIDLLNIFSINLTNKFDYYTFIIDEWSTVRYIEIGVISFIELMTKQSELFFRWNPYSLYILRDGNYRDMKYILSQVGKGINLGRGGSQKSQVLSPLDLRLSSYLMAMYNSNYKEVSSSNMFNKLFKREYLPYLEVRKK